MADEGPRTPSGCWEEHRDYYKDYYKPRSNAIRACGIIDATPEKWFCMICDRVWAKHSMGIHVAVEKEIMRRAFMTGNPKDAEAEILVSVMSMVDKINHGG